MSKGSRRAASRTRPNGALGAASEPEAHVPHSVPSPAEGRPMPPPGEHSLSVDMASATAVVEDVFYKQGIAVENAEVGSKAAEVWMAPLPDPAVRRGHRAAAIVGTLGVLALLSLIVWKSRLLSGDSADRGTSGGAPAAVVPVQSAP